jgi:chromosome segregation ATPase
MDQETREMFGKVLGVLGIIQTDIAGLKLDVQNMKEDIAGLKLDVQNMKEDIAGLTINYQNMKRDIAGLAINYQNMKEDITALKNRQDEMYLMLKGSEESRLRLKSLEEKSSISAIERDQLKIDSAKIVGALRRGAHEILEGLDEDVS